MSVAGSMGEGKGAAPVGPGAAVDSRQARKELIAEIEKLINKWGLFLSVNSANDWFAYRELRRALSYLREEQELTEV